MRSAKLVHNSFRTRGVTLTSFELRRLVAEVLASCNAQVPEPPLVVFTAEPAAERQAMDRRRTSAAGAFAEDVPRLGVGPGATLAAGRRGGAGADTASPLVEGCCASPRTVVARMRAVRLQAGPIDPLSTARRYVQPSTRS